MAGSYLARDGTSQDGTLVDIDQCELKAEHVTCATVADDIDIAFVSIGFDLVRIFVNGVRPRNGGAKSHCMLLPWSLSYFGTSRGFDFAAPLWPFRALP
ncbi:hypothetical protein VTJ49DRAFT_806 [Mycothermus thermophilus]|uniref:Uncharacterized protein n=1 Tax=Humicola insolens TaxID=85995 RepID=A0ABR3VF75_HUMIN